MSLDRRFLWLVFGLILLAAVVFPVKLPPLDVAPSVRSFYSAIDTLPENSAIVLSIDFLPSFKPELEPMADAVCRHAFRKNIKIIAFSLYDGATGLAQEILRKNAVLCGKEYGVDYAYLGWQPNDRAMILGLGSGFSGVFPRDFYGTPLAALPLFANIRSLYDIPLVVQIGAGFSDFPVWLGYGTDKTGGKMIIGCNGGAEPALRPYYGTGQIAGLVASTKGAAEYEQLLGIYGGATRCFNASGLVQFILGFLLIAANLVFWRSRGWKLGFGKKSSGDINVLK